MHDAYVAGFIDADGCISVNYSTVHRVKTGKQKTKRKAYFNVSVVIVQKEEKVVMAFFNQYGGTMNITKRGIHRYFRWTVSGKAVIPLLRAISPYIVEKQEQVNLALEAAIHQSECGRGRYRAGCKGIQPLSEADLEYRKSVWLKVKSLNTCHKFHAAAETKSNEPEKVSDSPALSVMAREDAKSSATSIVA